MAPGSGFWLGWPVGLACSAALGCLLPLALAAAGPSAGSSAPRSLGFRLLAFRLLAGPNLGCARLSFLGLQLLVLAPPAFFWLCSALLCLASSSLHLLASAPARPSALLASLPLAPPGFSLIFGPSATASGCPRPRNCLPIIFQPSSAISGRFQPLLIALGPWLWLPPAASGLQQPPATAGPTRPF